MMWLVVRYTSKIHSVSNIVRYTSKIHSVSNIVRYTSKIHSVSNEIIVYSNLLSNTYMPLRVDQSITRYFRVFSYEVGST